MDKINKIINFFNENFDDYMSGGVTKHCPRCSHKNIVSYPKMVCVKCEYNFPIESLKPPVVFKKPIHEELEKLFGLVNPFIILPYNTKKQRN